MNFTLQDRIRTALANIDRRAQAHTLDAEDAADCVKAMDGVVVLSRVGSDDWIKNVAVRAHYQHYVDNPVPQPDPIDRNDVVKALEEGKYDPVVGPATQAHNNAFEAAIKIVKGL